MVGSNTHFRDGLGIAHRSSGLQRPWGSAGNTGRYDTWGGTIGLEHHGGLLLSKVSSYSARRSGGRRQCAGGGGGNRVGPGREGLAWLGLGCGLPFRAGMKRAHRWPGRQTPLCVTNQIKSTSAAAHPCTDPPMCVFYRPRCRQGHTGPDLNPRVGPPPPSRLVKTSARATAANAQAPAWAPAADPTSAHSRP